MAVEYFYPGTKYKLDSRYGEISTGYQSFPAGRLGATTSIQTANQLKEVNSLLNQGIKNIEVSTINADIFEQIPKQHLKEINRLTKLTGSEATLHAPILDPSGFTQQGWDEGNRQAVERQFTNIVERGHELNPEGNIPITIHASMIPGTEYMPVKDKATGKITEMPQKMVIVNQESGEFAPLMYEKKFDLETGKEREFKPQEELPKVNKYYWERQLSQLVYYKSRADSMLENSWPLIAGQTKEEMTHEKQKAAKNYVDNAMIDLRNSYQYLNTVFNQAYKFSDQKGKDELKKIADSFKEQYNQAKNSEAAKRIGSELDPALFSGAMQKMMGSMQELTERMPPPIYRPVDDFVKEKASETLGNVAWNNYKKFKETTPIISIENPPYGSAGARAEDLKALIEETRNKFVNNAVKDGMSEFKARDAAEKLIGATWDTSHISMMRKQGFGSEKLVEEAKIISPYLKHIHLNDNFGSTHTDLPPGMGNVPIKDILNEFKGFKGKAIHEGGGFFAQFQTSPNPYVLEALGSPVYAMDMAPYWNQTQGLYKNYFGGGGEFLPQVNYETFGTGFSQLPSELGGSRRGGAGGRMSGTPME